MVWITFWSLLLLGGWLLVLYGIVPLLGVVGMMLASYGLGFEFGRKV